MWNYKGLSGTKIELSICRVIYLFDFWSVWDFMVMADGFHRFRQIPKNKRALEARFSLMHSQHASLSHYLVVIRTLQSMIVVLASCLIHAHP